MMSRQSRVVLTLVLAFFALGSQQAAAAPTKPKVSWSPCFKAIGHYECATVHVPLDYDEPNGASVGIALVRLPATDPARRIGSLFLNPGGPGGSGIDFTLFAGPFLYSDEVRARFDLVGFDPRGILRSATLRCFGTPRQWGPFFTPFAFPTTPEELEAWIAADLYLVNACTRSGGRIAEHMSTANVARDLDLLRQAVGDDRLTYAGYSYGSMLGQTYANMFPDKVRSLVIDGVLDPIAWANLEGEIPFSTRLRSDDGAQKTLDEFFRLCDLGGPTQCSFAPDSASRYADLADAVKAEPIVVTLPDGETLELNYSILVAITLGPMYDSLGWEEFDDVLADIEEQVENALPSLTLGARLAPLLGEPGYIPNRGFPRYPNFLEGFPAVACSDGNNPDSYDAWVDASASSFGYFGPLWTWVSSICAQWPFEDADRYTGPWNRMTANPVLVVGTRFDPATRYEGAVTAHALLPNSELLTVEGWGHTSLFLSACADAAVSAYLLNPAAAATATCSQDHVPFSGP